MIIKIAESSHIQGILDIYARSIEDSHTSFEYQIPSFEEMKKRVEQTLRYYPWIIVESERRVLGYAYATRFRTRKAYDWVCESSVYVHPHMQSRGIGSQLYKVLLALLTTQGIHQCIAGVALPNEASIKFHEKFGFQYAGVFKKVGYKTERWVDVGFWQLELKPGPPASTPIPWHQIPFEELEGFGIKKKM
jgi:phosphinothricin acetyltransferase